METHRSQPQLLACGRRSRVGTRSFGPFQTTAPDSQDSPRIIAVERCGGKWKAPQACSASLNGPVATGAVLAVPGADSPLPPLPFSANTLLNRVPLSRPVARQQLRRCVGREQPGPRARPGHSGPARGLWRPQPRGPARTWAHILLNLQRTSDYREGLRQKDPCCFGSGQDGERISASPSPPSMG